MGGCGGRAVPGIPAGRGQAWAEEEELLPRPHLPGSRSCPRVGETGCRVGRRLHLGDFSNSSSSRRGQGRAGMTRGGHGGCDPSRGGVAAASDTPSVPARSPDCDRGWERASGRGEGMRWEPGWEVKPLALLAWEKPFPVGGALGLQFVLEAGYLERGPRLEARDAGRHLNRRVKHGALLPQSEGKYSCTPR